MPDLWTHMLCGHEVLKHIEEGSFKEIIENEIKLFNLGTQGGDIFFYYKFWPWIGNMDGTDYAHFVHTKRTGELFINGLDYLKYKIDNENDFNKIFSYLAGFMCHFAMDTSAHPYIFYFSGIYDSKKPETKKFIGWHKKLEVIIDTILLEEKKGMKTFRNPAHKEIYIGKSVPQSIKDFFTNVMDKLYGGKINGDFINIAYKDMIHGLKIMHDTTGIKASIVRAYEFLTGSNKKYSDAIYQKVGDLSIDYLNKNHYEWLHPCDNREIHRESFYDLYERAVERGEMMVKTAIEYLNGKCDMDTLKEMFPSVSYYTGKPVDDNCSMMYFKLISER